MRLEGEVRSLNILLDEFEEQGRKGVLGRQGEG